MNFTSSGWIAGETVLAWGVPAIAGQADGPFLATAVADARGVAALTGLPAGRAALQGGTSGRRVLTNVVAPKDNLDLLTGEATCDRTMVQGAAVTTSAGTIRWGMFTALRTEPVTSLRVCTGSTPAAATPTLIRLGVWTVDAANNLTLAAATDNDVTLLAAANTAYTKALAVPFVKQKGQRYALGLLVVSGVATPTLAGPSGVPASGLAWMDDQVRAAALAGQADLPGSVAAASLVATTAFPYIALI